MIKVAVILIDSGEPFQTGLLGPNFMGFRLAKFFSLFKIFIQHKLSINSKKALLVLQKTDHLSELLEKYLTNTCSDPLFKIFIWTGFKLFSAFDSVLEVKKFNPDEIILLSWRAHATYKARHSSFEEWKKIALHSEIKIDVRTIECWFNEGALQTAGVSPEFIYGLAQAVRDARTQKMLTPGQECQGLVNDCGARTS
jgi:hypothetical protein